MKTTEPNSTEETSNNNKNNKNNNHNTNTTTSLPIESSPLSPNNNNTPKKKKKKRNLENSSTSYFNKFDCLDQSDDNCGDETKEMVKKNPQKKKKTNNISTNINKAPIRSTSTTSTSNPVIISNGKPDDNTKAGFAFMKNEITIKDIQHYIQWLMLRFKIGNPSWILTKQSPLIHKVVVANIGAFSSLMHTKLSLLTGKEIFSSTFRQEQKIELHLPNHNHVYDSLWNVKIQNKEKTDELLKEKVIEPKSFYMLSDDELIENGYLGMRDMKEGWAYTKYEDEQEEQAAEGADKNDDYEMLAIDCEMCRTCEGLELARISIINENKKVVLDEFVLPENPILDYLTQYSGITKKTLDNVTNRVSDIHKKLEKLITSKTILIGHSLENDLKAMKYIHKRVIDTSVLFPTGSSGKFPLKYLTKKYLYRVIQNRSSGHDSIEDAKAVLDLVKLKISKGRAFGTKFESFENLFNRIHKYEKKTTFIDRIDDIKQHTTSVVSCFNHETDADIVERACKQVKGSSDLISFQLSSLSDHFKSLEPPTINLNRISALLKEQEVIVDENGNEILNTITETTTTTTTTTSDSSSLTDKEISQIQSLDGISITPKVKGIVAELENQIKQVYDSLQENTLFILILGPGPLNEIKKFKNDGNKQNDYMLAVETAKEGLAFLTIK
ncbi:hypothetical protein CYY_005617 [Polysphondylium violaceum]|uniref:Exonuclease domain-containing protein n=1 Tax=Polysphondylium violaceum TaxID=133409 RepID=A0A8J4PT87_9MYCE|nr:hypothetical protein CYY_005617 [Polysphondylium violaceum]